MKMAREMIKTAVWPWNGIASFNKYLLSNDYVPNIGLDTDDYNRGEGEEHYPSNYYKVQWV